MLLNVNTFLHLICYKCYLDTDTLTTKSVPHPYHCSTTQFNVTCPMHFLYRHCNPGWFNSWLSKLQTSSLWFQWEIAKRTCAVCYRKCIDPVTSNSVVLQCYVPMCLLSNQQKWSLVDLSECTSIIVIMKSAGKVARSQMKRFEVSPTYTSHMDTRPACQMEFILQVEVTTRTQAC